MINIDESEGIRADRVGKTGIVQNDSRYGLGWRQETSVHRFWASHRYVTRVVYELPGFFARKEN